MLRRLTDQIVKLIDTAHEAAHAVSACVELAREAEANRYSAADAFRDGILNKENGRLVDERDKLRLELKELREQYDTVDANLAASDTERDRLRVELKSTVQDRDKLLAELERVQLALGKATEAHRLAHKLRDPKFYTARTRRAVSSEGSIRQRTTSAEACAAVARSDDPCELVRVAFEHWDSIGWPEDKAPVALLKRALEMLGDA